MEGTSSVNHVWKACVMVSVSLGFWGRETGKEIADQAQIILCKYIALALAAAEPHGSAENWI